MNPATAGGQTTIGRGPPARFGRRQRDAALERRAGRVEVAAELLELAFRELHVGPPTRVRLGERQDARLDLLDAAQVTRERVRRELRRERRREHLANARLQREDLGLPAIPLRALRVAHLEREDLPEVAAR